MEGNTKTFCGTPQYLAPEVILGQEYDRRVDWWALGILLYEMVVGMPPFKNKNLQLNYQEILNKKVSHKDYFSNDFKNLINQLLKKDPNNRLGSEKKGGIDGIKKHKFFKVIDWEKVYNKEYKAPFKPKIKNVQNIHELIENTPDTKHNESMLNKMHFIQFTYSKEKENLAQQDQQVDNFSEKRLSKQILIYQSFSSVRRNSFKMEDIS